MFSIERKQSIKEVEYLLLETIAEKYRLVDKLNRASGRKRAAIIETCEQEIKELDLYMQTVAETLFRTNLYIYEQVILVAGSHNRDEVVQAFSDEVLSIAEDMGKAINELGSVREIGLYFFEKKRIAEAYLRSITDDVAVADKNFAEIDSYQSKHFFDPNNSEKDSAILPETNSLCYHNWKDGFVYPVESDEEYYSFVLPTKPKTSESISDEEETIF